MKKKKPEPLIPVGRPADAKPGAAETYIAPVNFERS